MDHDDAGLPTTPRLATKRVGLAAALAGAALIGMVLMSLLQRQRVAEQPPPPPLPPLYEVQGDGDGLQRLNLKTSWAGEDRTPPAPPAPPTRPPSTPTPSPLFPDQPAVPTPPLPARTAAPAPPAPPAPPVGKQATVEPIKPPTTMPTPKAVRSSLFSQQFAFAKPPFAPPKEEQGAEAQRPAQDRERTQGSVIRDATWEKPSDGSRVWYRSQALIGQLAEEVVSSLGGQVVIRVTRPLEDKQLRGVTLIPQHSLIVAKQAGKPDYGQDRLPLEVEQIELPDDSILVPKAQSYDQFGGAGVGGTVQNHYGRVLFGAVLSALLSVGTRIPAGNTQGFVPTIGQDVAASASQDIAQTGRQIIQRELDRSPTITLAAGTPVRIHPNENINFVRGPKVLR